jgi:ribonuclease P/MRP protein subunit POP5
MRVYKIDEFQEYIHLKAVLRCQRGFEDKVRVALSLLTKFKSKKIAINTIGTSGTISASISRYIN